MSVKKPVILLLTIVVVVVVGIMAFSQPTQAQLACPGVAWSNGPNLGRLCQRLAGRG